MRSELDQVPGLEPMIIEVVHKMRPDFDLFLADIKSGDRERIRETAHRSKGLFGMYGFPVLADLYSRCEHLCVKAWSDDSETPQKQLTRLASDIDQVVRDVRTSYSLH